MDLRTEFTQPCSKLYKNTDIKTSRIQGRSRFVHVDQIRRYSPPKQDQYRNTEAEFTKKAGHITPEVSL